MAHFEQIKWMGDPTAYELWDEMESLMRMRDPMLLRAILANKKAHEAMKKLLRPE